MGDDEGDLGADVTAQFDTYAPRTIPAPPARTRPRRSGGSGRDGERSPLGAPHVARGLRSGSSRGAAGAAGEWAPRALLRGAPGPRAGSTQPSRHAPSCPADPLTR